MSSALVSDRDTVLGALSGLEAAFDAVAGLSFDALTNPEVLVVLSRLEIMSRREPVIEHRLITKLVRDGSAVELGAKNFADVLTAGLRISRKEAHRRLGDAKDLGQRSTLTGEPVQPCLPLTAAAQVAGRIGAEHITIIRKFFAELPTWVDYQTRGHAEADLARIASEFGPSELHRAADRLAALVNPDGDFTDVDRARKRGFIFGRQGADGMSKISGLADPELRATLDAAFSKLAAPGMCNPDDESPCVKGRPSEALVRGDRRTTAQRRHDGLTALSRSMLASGELGSHHGLPVTVIVSTTLADLESAAGQSVTGGGTLLPMSDLIRMASHAHHYLVIYDDAGRVLNLGREKRIASPDQRIVLHSKDRGCTFPGCTVPGFLTEVHHAECDWADDGLTNVNDLTLACHPHNVMVKPGGWRTRKRRDGRTEWIPPPHLDNGQGRVNKYHHVEEFLVPEDPPEDDEPQ
jgi:hypothetical protein